jgi:lipid A oxidase
MYRGGIRSEERWSMLGRILGGIGLAHIILGILVATLALSQPTVRRYGDNLQVALPILAWGCSVTAGGGKEFAIRFAVMFTAAHGSKAVLGETPLNRRPGGGESGFPSAHTAAAALGASALVHGCLRDNPVAQGIVLVSAAFVGGSRIEVGAHTIWQVLAGGLLGWGADRMLRADTQARRRVVLAGHATGRAAQRGIAAVAWTLRAGALRLGLFLAAVSATHSASAEVEFSAYGGFQTAPHSTIRHSFLGNDHVKWEGKSFEMPPYWGLRATWWRNERFGYGAEINHAKVYADDPESYGYELLELTDGINLLTANVWRRWPNDGRWTPYAGAGLGVAIPHVEVKPMGEARTFGYQLTGPAVQLVAGASWEIDPKWSVFGEYKLTWSSHEMDLDSGGTLSTDIITNALNIGLGFRF